MLDGAFIPELFGASPCVVRKIWNEGEARVILVHLKTEAGNSLCGLEFVGLCLVDAFISTFNGEDLLGDCVVVTVGSEDSTREIKTEAERVKVSCLRRLWGETAESPLVGLHGGGHLGAEGVVPVGAIEDDGLRLWLGGEVVCV